MELDVLYRDLPSYQPESVGDLVTAEETRAVPPPMLSTEPIIYPLELAGEMMVAYTMPLVLTTAGLRVIANPASPMLIVEPALSGIVTSLTSLVTGVLVSMKTSSQLPVIPHPSQTNVSTTSFTVMMVRLVEILPLGITHSSGVIEAEKEFVAKMVDIFYKSFEAIHCLDFEGLDHFICSSEGSPL